MEKVIVTDGDIVALKILVGSGVIPITTDMPLPNIAGDMILELAERIKRERSIAGVIFSSPDA